MRAPIFLVLVFLVSSVLAGISSSTGLQRKIVGDNCTFQWTTTGTVNDFVVYNQTTGTSVAQNSRVSLKRDSTGNTINMTITSIALWDAGNYTLSTTNGGAWENDSSALLFVFVTGSVSMSQTAGRNPALEGDLVELTCTFTSNSKPAAYRPRALYSFWYVSRFSYALQVLSNGSLQIPNGGIVSGYSTSNNGRTLTIAAVQYNDNSQNIGCYVNEEGSPSTTAVNYIYLYVQYKPVVVSTNPPTRKFNAIVGERVTLSVNQVAYPVVFATGNNWTFVSNGGYDILDVPEGSVVGTYTAPSLSFTLPSIEYYGKYSYNMSNLIGTTTVTFEVLPPAKPDPPAAFQVAYATHFSIALQWNCMWSNFNGRIQYVYTQLRDPRSNVTLGNQSTGLSGTCYNSTSYFTFNSNIQPETNYEAIVWSTNEIGTSDVVRISLRSAKVFRFIISSDSIKLNGTTATVNYRIESGNIASFRVYYCYELTAACYYSDLFYVNSNIGEVNFSIGLLPNGTEFVFDFYLYVGRAYTAICGFVKGIRVSRAIGPTTFTENNDANKGDYVPAVIALAVVLGIAILAIIGMFIGFLIWKRRNFSPKSNQQELQRTNPAEAEDYYEAMNRQDSENRVYANLDQTKSI